jgi:hypothetical protein
MQERSSDNRSDDQREKEKSRKRLSALTPEKRATKRAKGRKQARERHVSGYERYGLGGFHRLESSANRRNLKFDLTPETLESWWLTTTDICSYCGIAIADFFKLRDSILAHKDEVFEVERFKMFFRNEKHANIRWMTIDRVHNERGYEIENMVKSCWICNKLKGNVFAAEEMKVMAPKLIGNLLKDLNLSNILLAGLDAQTSDAE